ncbi:MAG: NlpC/P60 family protein [Mycobacterium sp.]|nr:MAG: NlpC/P60 family protein [Mycobacterium sp.]
MARRGVWIGMAVAIPATVAFTPFHPLEPALQDPNVVAQPQPVVATTPVATAQPVVATTPVAAAPATAQNLPAGSSAMAAPDRDVGSIVVNAALTRVGAPYVWGDAGPDSFDCSGLVVWAFHQAGITVPHSSEALATGGQPVALDQMQPGDVISFFPDASHVGIYVGDGRVIHASFEGLPVTVESLYTAPINAVRHYG